MKKDTEKKVIYTFDEMKKKPVKAGVIVDGNIFHKKVKNEHYMVKEHGYGIQRDVIEMLALKGVEFVYIHAKTVVLKSKLSDWVSKGHTVNYGAGLQVFLSTKEMQVIKDE